MGSLLPSGSSLAMDGAAPLLLGLHGRLLRLVSAHAGCHFEGLAVAGRYLFKQGAVDSATKKKLQNLDIVVAFLRHLSELLCEGIVANVGDQLKNNDKKEDDEKGDEKVSDNEHTKEDQLEEVQQDDEKEDDEKEGQQDDEEGQGRRRRQREKEREEKEEEKAEKERAGKAEKQKEKGLENLLLEVQKLSARNEKKLAENAEKAEKELGMKLGNLLLEVQEMSAPIEKKPAEESEDKDKEKVERADGDLNFTKFRAQEAEMRRAEDECSKSEVEAKNGDPPLLRGDFVTFRGVTVQVMRVGCGAYGNKVHIRLPTEADCWSMGRWVDTVEVTRRRYSFLQTA